MSDIKIIATVVLYNPDNRVVNNIKSYIDFVDELIVIDNSIVKNSILIDEILNIKSIIKYINNFDNLGIGYALNISAEYAIKNGYKWLMTMDQDSYYEDCALYINCFKSINDRSNIAIFAPNTDRVKSEVCDIKKPDIVITSGNIINLSYFNEIGKFEEKFFIDEIDHDYCLKVKKLNLEIIQFRNVFLGHTIGDEEILTSILLKKKKKKSSHSHVRVYYQTRNRLYMWKKYGKSFPEYFSLYKVLYKVIYKKTFRIIQWEDNKLMKLKAVYIGILDFFSNKYGKYEG